MRLDIAEEDPQLIENDRGKRGKNAFYAMGILHRESGDDAAAMRLEMSEDLEVGLDTGPSGGIRSGDTQRGSHTWDGKIRGQRSHPARKRARSSGPGWKRGRRLFFLPRTQSGKGSGFCDTARMRMNRGGEKIPRRISPGMFARRRYVAGLVLMAWVATSAGAEEKQPDAPETWYAMSLVQSTARMAISHHWSRGDLYRALNVINGVPIVTIVDRDTYYMINAMNRTGVAIARSEKAKLDDAKRARPFATEWEDIVEAGGERIHTKIIGGVMTEAWRFTNDLGRLTAWVRVGKPRVPMRVETFHRQPGVTDERAYVNWVYGLPIPESFFKPSEGVKIRRFGYEEYQREIRKRPVGPAPPLYGDLLNGNN